MGQYCILSYLDILITSGHAFSRQFINQFRPKLRVRLSEVSKAFDVAMDLFKLLQVRRLQEGLRRVRVRPHHHQQLVLGVGHAAMSTK